MAYTPPAGNNVVLNFTGSYTAPRGDEVIIQFGNPLDNSIKSHDIYLEYSSDKHQIEEAYALITSDVTYELLVDQSIIDPLIHINPNDTEYELEIESFQLQILPDIVTADTVYESEFELQGIGGNRETDLPNGISPGMRMCWYNGYSADTHFIFPWGKTSEVDFHHNITAIVQLLEIDIHFSAVWKSMFIEDVPTGDSWKEMEHFDMHWIFKWDSMVARDRTAYVPYENGKAVSNTVFIPYGQPDPLDSFVTKTYGTNSVHSDLSLNNYYGGDVYGDISKEVPWGPRELFIYCFKNYVPPSSSDSVDFNFPSKYPLVLGANVLTFELDSYSTSPLCNNHHNHTGIRDNYITPGIEVDPVIPPTPFPVKPFYYIMNTVLVKTLPGNVPIEVKGLTMTTDRDSWLWQLNMTVGKREYVELLSPKNGTFPIVEIYINGWKWVYLIEGWSENKGFARGTYSITGRSPSMILSDPICDRKTLTVGTGATGSYIIQSILDSNAQAAGFSILFSGYENNQTGFDPATGSDWYIPANTFSYADQTDIQAMQTLVQSIGGYIQTNPAFYNYPAGTDGRILEILPKYAWQPWNWNLSNTDIDFKVLDKSIIREMGSSYKKNPDYYGAYIIGEAPKEGSSYGVYCDVYKQDKGPACKHAPIESSVLYTTDMIAQEKGRMIIGDAGVWRDHSIKVFSLFPDPKPPGLFRVGDYINVRDAAISEWIGLVVSTTIEASVVNSCAFSVSQNLGVSQYIGEWNG